MTHQIPDDEPVWLTYREAAKRVQRSVRTINRWRRAGMPMRHDEDGLRVVEEKVLLRWWRARLDAWPPHQYRLRALGVGKLAPKASNPPSHEPPDE